MVPEKSSTAERIYEVVQKIPSGYVATYAQIAEAAGSRKWARAVGNALHRNPDPGRIPCHRVVNATGEPAGRFAFGGAVQQARLLEAEGVEVINGKVDLEKYQWQPEKPADRKNPPEFRGTDGLNDQSTV